MEMSHMLEKMINMSMSEKPNSAKACVEQGESVRRLRRMVDSMIHMEEW